ncbi:MAG: DUF4296 domain-containing protein [Flavobacterium sp.]|nr:DUF4296 domain-containing protein [Flavobacterium sp.]
MKSYIVFFLFLFFSCSDKPVPKPDNLLAPETMEDILVDLALLQATDAANPDKLRQENINSKTFIYDKYSIDSITFKENHVYYASNIKKYKKIHKNVIDRLKVMKTEADSLKPEQKRVEKPRKELIE